MFGVSFGGFALLSALTMVQALTEYVDPIPGGELRYRTSKIRVNQMAILNLTGNVGMVMNANSKKLAFFNGKTKQGVLLNQEKNLAFIIKSRHGWSLEEDMVDPDLDEIENENADYIFQPDNQDPNSEVIRITESTIGQLCWELWDAIKEVNGSLFAGIGKVFGVIMGAMTKLLGPVMDLAVEGWAVFKGGFVALLNIFKWMARVVQSVTGGITTLIKKAITFKLNLIISAIDGTRAFFVMLKQLAENFDLATIFKGILAFPKNLVKFMVGLGGKVLNGMTGLFAIISQVLTFSLHSIATAIQTITNLLLRFLGGKGAPSMNEVTNSVDDLLDIINQQDSKYKNKVTFSETVNFLNGVKGQGQYSVQGINLGSVVRIIVNPIYKAKDVVMGILKELNPLYPMSLTLPQLLVTMVKSLNDTKGPSYVERLIPSIKLPKESLRQALRDELLQGADSGESLEDLQTLPLPDRLRKLPVVGQIYNELDQAARVHDNSTLDDMLRQDHVHELTEFTTQAFGLA